MTVTSCLSAGAAVGLGAAAVGGATLAGRSVAVKGADAGRGAMHVVSQVHPASLAAGVGSQLDSN